MTTHFLFFNGQMLLSSHRKGRELKSLHTDSVLQCYSIILVPLINFWVIFLMKKTTMFACRVVCISYQSDHGIWVCILHQSDCCIMVCIKHQSLQHLDILLQSQHLEYASCTSQTVALENVLHQSYHSIWISSTNQNV